MEESDVVCCSSLHGETKAEKLRINGVNIKKSLRR